MNAAASLTAQEAAGSEPAFRRIVVGIDGSRGALEAARQAAALAGRGTAVEVVVVANDWGAGLSASSLLSVPHARRSLDEIKRELRPFGIRPVTRIATGWPVYETLLDDAAGADLLVIGRHGQSRIGGLAIGSTATSLVHHARVPLLVAVTPSDGRAFPGRILVAADGPGHPERAVRLAGLIARDCGSDVTLVRLNWSHRARRPELAAAIAELASVGVTPVEILTAGLPRRKIPELAAQECASLLVVGSRGLGGPRALGSVSERVAHDAPCSVLIARQPLG